jgi:ABC-type molybdate transport system substrate-binding protein
MVAWSFAAAGAQAKRQLTVCYAGSLRAAFAPLQRAFADRHPDAVVNAVSGGSVALARRLAVGATPCDVYASADHLTIEALLKPAGLADYTVVFAAGRMVLAYLATDPYAQPLPAAGSFNPPADIPEVGPGWYQTLLAPGVRIAGAHPFLDPGGYRLHLILELAQAHYGTPDLYNSLLEHVAVIPAYGTTPSALGREYNFQFVYEHSAAAAARSNPSYRYARLPSQLDLSSGAHDSGYARASVTIPGLGLGPADRVATIAGSRAAWGLTIAKNSRNQELAVDFVALLLGPAGTEALSAHGPSPVTPPTISAEDYGRLPAALRPLVARR